MLNSNLKIAGTITPHHMLLTKKDVFLEKKINPHHFCMPVVKDETDLIELRNAACNNNSKFFVYKFLDISRNVFDCPEKSKQSKTFLEISFPKQRMLIGFLLRI